MGRILATAAFLWSMTAAGAAASKQIVSFGSSFDVSSLETRDITAKKGRAGRLTLEGVPGADWPGITVKPSSGEWDLSLFRTVSMKAANKGTSGIRVGLRVDNKGADGRRNCVGGWTWLDPGEEKAITVKFRRRMPDALKDRLFAMNGYPGEYSDSPSSIDPAKVAGFVIYVEKPKEPFRVEVGGVRADGDYKPSPPPEKLFPFVDTFGQYIHRNWPGKIRSVSDLKRNAKAELKDLARNPGPADWDKYGGWLKGPLLKATGHFYPVKHGGNWWLVDPEGRLFFSYGIDCVVSWNETIIDGREDYYRDLPAKDPDLAEFLETGVKPNRGYYKEKTVSRYHFSKANLKRKYGSEWEMEYAEKAHARIRSWGLNTIGNWSEEGIYLMRKTPYVVAVHFWSRMIEGSGRHSHLFYDVFDPDFAKRIDERIASGTGDTAGDPWCIGYFVDNELNWGWGDNPSLAVAALVSPPEQPAKKALMADLKAKYRTIAALNNAWNTSYASWIELSRTRTAPGDLEPAGEDLKAFYSKIARTYFEACRAAVKKAAPDNLYLGCRFAGANRLAVAEAVKYCDVVSYNLYRKSVRDFKLPDGADAPVIIGEFHMGALDRGMLHTGLVSVENQAERAQGIKEYVMGALANPLFVGCHWFQYMDQATTGRADGENYQIGFLDIADTPYPETIRASRGIGRILYRVR